MGTQRKRRTRLDYEELAQKRGFIWTDEEAPRTVLVPTGWQCRKGHRWTANYNNIQSGQGCPECAGTKPKTADDYRTLARRRGFTWPDDVVPRTTQVKTVWRCSKGHLWSAPYNSIQQGSNCPVCAGRVPKTADDYRKLAEQSGLTWTGEVVPERVRDATTWACCNNHAWRATYNSVQQGSRCPYCAGKAPKTEADYHTLAGKRELKWLGDQLPPTTRENTFWQCKRGHRWYAPYSRIRRGSNCPECSRLQRRPNN